VAVICVPVLVVIAAVVAPNFTAEAPVRFVPVMVTVVPPVVEPADGDTPVTVGGVTKVNLSAAPVALVPPGVVTVISTIPAEPAGELAMISVAELTAKTTLVLPNLTALAPVKLVPVIVTVVPPTVGPLFGETRLTVGGGVYVYWLSALVALVPPGFVTVTLTVPLPAGAVAVICVAELKVKRVAFVAPNFTAVAPLKPVPVRTTEVPPVVGPVAGVTPITVGAS
jgi:hypothetical protein